MTRAGDRKPAQSIKSLPGHISLDQLKVMAALHTAALAGLLHQLSIEADATSAMFAARGTARGDDGK